MAWLSRRPRQFWRTGHRWMAWVLGPLFVLLGVTGSVLVFYPELDERLAPALASARAAAQAQPVTAWQPVLAALERAHPQRDLGWRLELPPDGRGLVTARYLRPTETTGAFFAPLLVSVQPHSGEVLASRFWGTFAMTWLFDLHYTLLAGEAGRSVLGGLGLVLLALPLSGVLLWWPRAGHWRSALRWQRHASPQRRHYDWHKGIGLGSAALLLVLTLTGVALALPGVVEPWARQWGTPLSMPQVRVAREPGRALLSLDAALAQVQRVWPEGVPRWVDSPAVDQAVWRVRVWLPGEPSRRFPRSYVWLNAHTGEVLALRDARQQRGGEVLLAWLHPLHNGEAFGLMGRVLACGAGWAPLGLWLTGWLRWRDRRRAMASASSSEIFKSSVSS